MRSALKWAVVAVVFVLVIPFGVPARLLYRLTGSQVLFDLWAHLFSLAPGLPGQFVRRCYYRQTLDACAWNSQQLFGSLITKPGARIGPRTGLGMYSTLGLVDVGEGVLIASHVAVLSGARQHNFSDASQPLLAGEDTFERLHIGRDSFIGTGAKVMADIGERTILGAGSIVTRPIPSYVVAAGSPAVVVKQRKAPSAGTRAAGELLRESREP